MVAQAYLHGRRFMLTVRLSIRRALVGLVDNCCFLVGSLRGKKTD